VLFLNRHMLSFLKEYFGTVWFNINK
jgi:hypothetical protein